VINQSKSRCALAAAAVLVSGSNAAYAEEIGEVVPDLFICQMVPGPISVGYEARSAAAAVGGQIVHVYSHITNGFAIRVNARAIDALVESNPYISGCQPSLYVGLDAEGSAYPTKGPPGGGGGGGGKPGGDPAPSGQTTDWGVDRVGGPYQTTNGGYASRAYVVDTGVDLDHSDLTVNVDLSGSFLSSRGRGNDSPDDYNGHGTHVAGVIGALNNGYGTVGVAPGAEIVSIRVLDKNGSAPDADVAAGLEYLLTTQSDAQPGDVVNLSLVADPGSTILDVGVQALAEAGLRVVMAAGNGWTSTEGVSPAYNDGTNLYTVSAFKTGDVYSFPSNSGPSIDYAEPGESIFSLDKNGGFTTKSGSSMAAPHLSGILLATGGNVVSCGITSIGSAPYTDPDGTGDAIGVLPGQCN
jgi:hypothetical protein